ncbi:acyl-CoA thioesterase [Aquibium oceanicum]|uniref:Uncharacterized protein n=1 Tax=Aquibium oceanicum TaxID=1670800 RepID=A0A1L3SS73_9HYPH|nr:acyl-CoA thioesterase [Aquibium oceanicum]APH72172.1 hypothetical protein BSQ44_12960 [Aquibium oceanicum]
MSEILQTCTIKVSFGDCDPAGIVYYPNHFRWFDATFHALLQRFGGHAAVSRKLGSIGIGLIEVGGAFRAPAEDGDALVLTARLVEWREKTLRIAYEGRIDDRLTVEGFEVRGLFIREDGQLRAGRMAPLREMLEAGAGTADA